MSGTISTIIVGAVILAVVVKIILNIKKKHGICNCGSCAGSGSCPHCTDKKSV